MTTFWLQVLAVDRPFFEGKCLSLTVPTSDGQQGILAHHSNFISAVLPGELRMRDAAGVTHTAAVSEGLIKVENNEVLVLVESAERPSEIDANRAKREADIAKEAMLQKKSMMEYRSAQAQLARALNRLRVKSGNSDRQ